jgi:SAM-dependent methyltransferase
MSLTLCCPSCNSLNVETSYVVRDVPVHSVTLLSSQDQALNYPTGDNVLEFCHSCGFIFNAAFDRTLQDYSKEYESTQSYSPAFNEFHIKLAKRLIKDYDLRNKDIIEIGCGQGEFLNLLCELGANHGVGFDPAYTVEHKVNNPDPRAIFISDYYSEKYAKYQADFVCCKMTLEHIHNPLNMVSTVRRSLDNCSDTIVFFQVPDVKRILTELAFWDIYYEHCSYFSAGSLARLFRRSGFEVVNLSRDYDDQYLMIEARLASGQNRSLLQVEDDMVQLKQAVARFSASVHSRLEQWRRWLLNFYSDGKKVVIWGGGSKGVAFLTTLGII